MYIRTIGIAVLAVSGLVAGLPAQSKTFPVSELKPGMSQSEVRAKLGEPAYTEETADFVYWFYQTQKYVYFDRKSGKVRGWLGW